MKKLLAIGNSFTQDATRFLHDAAQACGADLRVHNLYIGGCSLERHVENIRTDKTKYLLEIDGSSTDAYVSIQEMLKSEDYDFILTQQASHDSGWPDTYEPFMGIIVDFLRKSAPKAKLFLHQTWAYEKTAAHPAFIRYDCDQAQMYNRLSKCYSAIAKKYGLPIIPCGDAVQTARQKSPFDVDKGGISLCRDGFHMHLVYGRYLLAVTLCRALLGVVVPSDFVPTNPAQSAADPELLKVLNAAAQQVF